MTTNGTTTVIEDLREARKRLGLSQGEVAEQMTESGVPATQIAISHYETGKRMPAGPAEMQALARVLGVDYDTLVQGFAALRGDMARDNYLAKMTTAEMSAS